MEGGGAWEPCSPTAQTYAYRRQLLWSRGWVSVLRLGGVGLGGEGGLHVGLVDERSVAEEGLSLGLGSSCF
jgi:hypothetical protein